MSLRQPSDGILQTHISWAEFEERMTKALNTTATFGVNKSAMDIGEGNGFASRCALIECDWQEEGTDQLPKRVVLKMPSCLALQKRMGDAPAAVWQMVEKAIRDSHNVECYAYDVIGRCRGAHAVPRRFYARKFDDENALSGQICMEYAEGAEMMDPCKAAPIEQMKQIACALGKIQAASIKVDVDAKSLKTTDAFADYTKTMTKEQFVCVFARLKQLEPALIEPLEQVEAVMGEYHLTNLPSTIHAQLGIKPVLVHGVRVHHFTLPMLPYKYLDMRTENVLVDKATGDLKMLIDWQLSHLGVGVEDLLRISFFAQTTNDRRKTAAELIEEMYRAVVSHLGNEPAPFSLDQLNEVYDILFPHCALFFATGLGLMLRPNKPQSGDDDEERKGRYEVCLDKARGVLEDIVKYHEMNMKSGKLDINWNYV